MSADFALIDMNDTVEKLRAFIHTADGLLQSIPDDEELGRLVRLVDLAKKEVDELPAAIEKTRQILETKAADSVATQTANRVAKRKAAK